MRIEKIKANYNVDIHFTHFPLHPDTPNEGKTLQALFGTNDAEVAKKNANMKAMMDAEGLPYGERTHTYNSRLAQELAAWAVTQDGGDAIHDAFFKAYFVDNKNIARVDVLLDVAESVGLSRADAETVLTTRSHQAVVDEDWSKSRHYGVTGVPTYVAGQNGVVGAQPYEVIEKLLQDAGVESR